MQEQGEVTLTLDGEGLMGGEDVVSFPSWADLLEGCCGQDEDATASELPDRCTVRLPIPTSSTTFLCLTCTISRAALAPGTPGFTHTTAAELAGEARGQRVLALVLSAHEAEAQALLLWFVGCRVVVEGRT